MARFLQVYPKASLVGSTWTFYIKVDDFNSGAASRFVHVVPAGVTASLDLRELKVVFALTVDDVDTDQDVDDALFVDDIRSGPQVETVVGNWIERAENIIGGGALTLSEYWAAWSKQDTLKTRGDVKKAMVDQRGWTITAVHQHEGDGTNTDESF